MVILVAVSTIGCSRGEVLGPVHGQVRFQGVTIKSGIVTFENAEKGVNMTSRVNENGEYQVSMAKGFGLPLGEYRVAVIPYVPDLLMPGKPRPNQEFKEIPLRYRKPETSGLTVVVQEGENQFDIEMVP